MKPLISYYGGKQRLSCKIVPLIEQIPHTVYVEPFFGGGAVFFARRRPMVRNNNYYREVINDHSELLINLYRTARGNPDEFYRWMTLTSYSRAEHQRAIEICRDPDNYSDIEKAWAYYVNIQQSFSSVLNKGWGTSVFGRNQAATWANTVQRIPQCLTRLADVHIECDDALAVIEQWDSPQTLFYLDPPYPGTECGHYDGYTLDDWQALCELLDRIDGSYILSNYPQAVEPTSAQDRIEITAIASSSAQGKIGKSRDKTQAATAEALGNRARTEVLWTCDRSRRMRGALSPALAQQRQISLF